MKKEKQSRIFQDWLVKKTVEEVLEKNFIKMKKEWDENKTSSIDCAGDIICENDIVAFTSKRAKLARKRFDCIGVVKFSDEDNCFVVKEIFHEGNECITLLDYADEFLIKIVKGEY